MLTVLKFGGSSLADAAGITNAARIAAEIYNGGSDTVVVVSAQGDTTDELLRSAGEINPSPPERELDALMATGELASAALVAMKLCGMGISAVSLSGRQAGIGTRGRYGGARIAHIDERRIQSELSEGKVVVIAGFQGINENDDLTTIGRGGSDTTAVAVAAALKADLCIIYTDVRGVYSADPRIVKDARLFERIGYDQMLEMSSLGAGVLHNRSVELAKKKGIALKVQSSFEKGGGTVICEELEGKYISGVTCDKNTALIEVLGGKTEILPQVLELLAENGISSDMITDIENRLGFTVPEGKMQKTVSVLSGNAERLGFVSVKGDSGVAKVSLVGCGLSDDTQTAYRMLSSLRGISVRSVVAGEIKISVLVPQALAEDAVRRVHSEFFA